MASASGGSKSQSAFMYSANRSAQKVTSGLPPTSGKSMAGGRALRSTTRIRASGEMRPRTPFLYMFDMVGTEAANRQYDEHDFSRPY